MHRPRFSLRFPSSAAPLLCAASLLGLHAAPAVAERADRLKPLNVEADQSGRVDLQNQVVLFSGNVVVSKGTMVIRAARIEVRQTPSGYDTATAFGTSGRAATFRQKRDGVEEFITGEADRLEYDGKADVIRFIGNAAVRRLRGASVADEITGNLVTYDATTEVFSVSGGAASTAANPGGRVRAVLTPREGSEGAAEAAREAATGTAPLKPSPSLGAARPSDGASGSGGERR
jgi:lipopolysaccharide export system protein LptA